MQTQTKILCFAHRNQNTKKFTISDCILVSCLKYESKLRVLYETTVNDVIFKFQEFVPLRGVHGNYRQMMHAADFVVTKLHSIVIRTGLAEDWCVNAFVFVF